MKRTIILIIALLCIFQGHAQTTTRDGFVEILGKKVDAPEVQQFFTSYEIKNTNGAKYSSTRSGIDIDTKKDTIVNINVYRSSSLYGVYTDKFSKGIAFGMTPKEVNDKLGKPTTAYTNSGYSEYAFAGYVLTCWFEQGILAMVSFSPK